MSATAAVAHTRRPVTLAAAVLLALTGLVVYSAPPADAATPAFYGTRAPLEWGGTTYDGPPFTETGTGVTYIGDDGSDTWVDTEPGEELSGLTGTTNIHAALATYDFGSGTRNVTIFVSDQVLQDASGGPYAATCAGIDAALFGGATACDAIVPNMLTSNGPGADFDDNGTGSAIDASDNPTSVSYTGDITPEIVWPNYQGSASPFTYNGADYDNDLFGGSGSGSGWLPAGSAPFFATDQPIALPVFPTQGPGDEIAPTHIALLDAMGQKVTLAIDGALFLLIDPMNPFTTSCSGLEDFFAAVMVSGIDCIAFRADVWSPPDALGETYTCISDWQTGWTDENDAPIDPANSPTVIEGFDDPALTPIGQDTGPGVCVAATPPTPPDPPTPPTPPTPDGTDSPGGNTGGTGTGTGTAPTLPATGVGTPALAVAALALLGVGTAFTLTARRRFGTARATPGD